MVQDHIQSVWALELLLLLRRERGRLWREEDLVRELRASTSVVSENLARFERCGLVAREGPDSVRYAPAGPILHAFCEALAEAYQTRPVGLINMIVSQSRLQALADAFKLKGPGR